MKNLKLHSFNFNDFLLIALFLLSVIPFVGGQVAAESLIPLKSAVIGVMWFNCARIPKYELRPLPLIFFCLLAVFLLHDCGVGSILNFLNMYVLLLLIPYMRFSKYTFTILGFICLGLCFFQYQYISNNVYSLFEEGNLNANSVGLFMFFISSLVILFFTNTDSWLLKLISLTSTIVIYPVLHLTYCRSAMLAYTCLILFYFLYIIPIVRKFFYKRSEYIRIIGVVLIVFNIVFVLLASYTSLNDYLSVFLENSEVKHSVFSDRHYIWRDALALFVKDPIFGVGNHIQISLDGVKGTAVLHNSFLAFLIYYGIIVYYFAVKRVKSSFNRVFHNFQNDLSTMLIPIVMIGVFVVATFETVLLQEFMFFSVLPLIFAENKKQGNLLTY